MLWGEGGHLRHNTVALFGEEQSPDAPLPRITRIVIGADSDNTGSKSLGWVADLRWQANDPR